MDPNLLMGAEWRALAEMGRLFLEPVYYGVGVPYGDRKPIVLIPGFMWGDWSVTLLARWLGRVGYRPVLSGIGINSECPREAAGHLAGLVEGAGRGSGQKTVLIGHSKGGYIARYLAQTRPELVSHVIALGAPYKDPLDANWVVRSWLEATIIWNRIASSSGCTDCYSVGCPCGFGKTVRRRLPAGVGYTAFYTRTDGVARWTNCLDGEDGRNIEVSGSHSGLTVNAEVYRQLASILRAIPVEPLPAKRPGAEHTP